MLQHPTKMEETTMNIPTTRRAALLGAAGLLAMPGLLHA